MTTAVKMPIVNVGPQVSADVCKGKGDESGPMRTARENSQWGEGGSKMALFADILYVWTRKPQFKPEFKPQFKPENAKP